MRQFHGQSKRRHFFEGWYLKHQNSTQTLALIPSYQVDASGQPSASLQIITDQASYFVPFPAHSFHAHPHQFHVQLGPNCFSRHGVILDIHTADCCLSGTLHYGPWQPLCSDIMGPFRFVPFLQCNHGVLSLFHSLDGALTLNGVRYCFDDGQGYIEKDWGSSFPSMYTWTQSNDLGRPDSCVMLAIATIPLGAFHFTGCICSIAYQGVEYRLATYQGARILVHTDGDLLIEQDACRFHAHLIASAAQALHAPVQGGMARIVHESASCRVRYRFWIGKRLIFDHTSERASFESSRSETR